MEINSKNIIVTIDFSDESMNALRFALVFVKKIRANIHLIYVINSKNKFVNKDGIDERSFATEQFEKIVSKFQVRLKKSKMSYHILKGVIHLEIIKFADSINADLIFTSTSGISGFKEYLVGKVANKIISYSKVPVISVKDDSCSRVISKIVVPVDRTLDSRQKLPIAAEIAKKHKAEIHLLFLDSSNTAVSKSQLTGYKRQVCKFLDKEEVPYKTTNFTGDNFPQMIQNYSKSIKANLIVVMSEQDSITKNLILGKNSQQLVNISTFPVLCFKPKELYKYKGDYE
jgi:nucleotide-binding universal stress UspA family protein